MNLGLKTCQQCGQAADEDGAEFQHNAGHVRVWCPCGQVTEWCKDMNEAQKKWDDKQVSMMYLDEG